MAVDPKTLKVGDKITSRSGKDYIIAKVDLANDEIHFTDGGFAEVKDGAWWWEKATFVSRVLSIPDLAPDTPTTTNDAGHPRFIALLDRMRLMHISKSGDYGDESDTFANYKRVTRLGVRPALGIAIRLEDKVARIEKYFKTGKLNNESVFDSLLDLANYALGICVLIEEESDAQ